MDELIAEELIAATCDRLVRALVVILIEEGPDDVKVGSGVLVRLAGAEFVLTAGHNVWDKDKSSTIKLLSAGQAPRGVVGFTYPGDGSISRIHVPQAIPGHDPEPDVAVIELSDRACRYQDRTPFEEHEFGFLDPAAPSCRVVVAGFPSGSVSVDKSPLPDGIQRKPALQLQAETTISRTMPERRAMIGRLPRNEPPQGRGTHVFFSNKLTYHDGSISVRHSAPGMSGGPLVLLATQPQLIGLVRSRNDFVDGQDQWCEPAVEAVRLLTGHESPDVSAAATRIVDRLVAVRERAEG